MNKGYWFGIILFSVCTIIGCSLLQEHAISPTAPDASSAAPGAAKIYGYYTQKRLYGYPCARVAEGMFDFTVMPGEYLVSYTTNLGRFHIVLRVLEERTVSVGLQEGDAVQEMVLWHGIITNTGMRGMSQQMQWVSVDDSITIASWPGIEHDAFVIDPTMAPITFITQGQVNSEANVCTLPEPQEEPTPSPPSPPSPDPTPTPLPPNDLIVKLAWGANGNLDLFLSEPTGGLVGRGHAGNYALSNGDNMCGFGSACEPLLCTSNLTCNALEIVHIPPFKARAGLYLVTVDSLALIQQSARIVIQTPFSSRSYTCTIPVMGTENIASVTFQGGTIQDVFDPGVCTVN